MTRAAQSRNIERKGMETQHGSRVLVTAPPQGWGELCRHARVYLVSGAFVDAHALLEPYVDVVKELPHEAHRIECLCLLLTACRRLGHTEHFRAGCAELRRHLAGC